MAVPSSERRRSAYFRPTTEILLTLFLATASASHPRPSPRSECRQPPPNSSGSLTDGLVGRYASEKRLTGNGFAVQVVEDVGGGAITSPTTRIRATFCRLLEAASLLHLADRLG